MLRVADIIQESIVDGPGIRSVVFFQGCTHNCQGCHNPATHPFEGGQLYTPSQLAERVLEGLTPLHRGVTLSGGDPLQQPQEELAEFARLLLAGAQAKWHKKISLWAYTGYTYDQVKDLPAMEYVEVLVDGPFVLAQRNLELPFRGSNNQRLIQVQPSLREGRVVELLLPPPIEI